MYHKSPPIWFLRLLTVAFTIVDVLVCAAYAGPAPDRRPNVIIIVADDLGYADLSIHGARDISTPHIDSLAANGIRFTAGYVTGPYCSPTRAALLTGRYQQRFGHEFNPNGDGPELGLSLKEATIADAFKGAGYRTALVGKWHQGRAPHFHPNRRGFDEFFGFLPAAHAYLPAAGQATQPARAELAFNRPGTLYRNDQLIEEPGYTTDVFAREASLFIERNRANPFFLYLAPNAVHTPLQATDKYLARFPQAEGKRRTYLAMVSALDDLVGQVLQTLRAHGIEDNTQIWFFSDNGGPSQANGSLNTPFSGGKATVWEGGIRVPFLVQWKAQVARSTVIDVPVAQIDIFPTAIAAASIQPPAGKVFDGRSILPLLTGGPRVAHHDLLFWRFGPQYAVRDARWKLARLPGIEQPRLFDLTSDIAEQADRAAEHPEIVQRLQAAWDAWDRDNQPPAWGPANARPARADAKPRTRKGKQP